MSANSARGRASAARRSFRIAAALCCSAASFAGAAACGPVPGGSLSGTVSAPPEAWSTLLEDGRAFCEIESRPTDPHSIQLDCFLYEGDLYVQSHRWALESWWPGSSWAAIWIEQPELRVRIGDEIFELEAVRVSEPSQRAQVLDLRGYDEAPDGIVVFRFDPRSR